MKAPEPIVHTVDAHLPGLAAGLLHADDGVGDDERNDAGERRRGLGLFLQVGCQLFPKETRRGDDVVGLTQTSNNKIAETAAHGIADQQCAGENGDRGRHAEHHSKMRAPVIREAAEDQTDMLTHPPDSRLATSP